MHMGGTYTMVQCHPAVLLVLASLGAIAPST
jgi:hypothetical protein